MTKRPHAVVLGMMTKMPVAGVVWQTVHYLIGLQRLGYDVYYVEAHARTPTPLMVTEHDDGSALAAKFIDGVMRRFDLHDRWAFHALHNDGGVYGLGEAQLRRVYRQAEFILNLHGGTEPRPEHYETGRLVYVETDPVQLQIELHDGLPASTQFLQPHCAFFTFGENYGTPGCRLPVSSDFQFLPTRQPVVMDFWANRGPLGTDFRTIGNWRQSWRPVHYEGRTLHWSKDREFERFLPLPTVTGERFALALSSYEPEDQRRLEAHGWSVADALPWSGDLDQYRDFIVASKAEFTVAKQQNVHFKTGWFSDRSATFLAAGRPVVTQDTGFGSVLPVGEGLFAVDDLDAARSAVEAIAADPGRHGSAAHDIAHSYFSHEVVLGRLLDDLGAARPRRSRISDSGFPAHLVIRPRSKRPLVLDEDSERYVLNRPVPTSKQAAAVADPVVSIVVVVYQELLCTRLCLESIVALTKRPTYEVIVVDNASTDGTGDYLAALERAQPHVRVITQPTNTGFAGGVNAGAAAACGRILVILNNDTIVTDGWLHRLVAPLEDSSVGMVGPSTNAAPTAARVNAPYDTFGEMLQFAAGRARTQHPVDVDDLTMVCVALRRDVYETVGPLDEQFGAGLFEDDDYVQRLKAAGLRLVLAKDVFVHHFGEATIGRLHESGQYGSLFERNRALFESKWRSTWGGHDAAVDEHYKALRDEIVSQVVRATPPGARIAVISKGDDALLCLDGRHASHFPAEVDGTYSGSHPGTTEDIVRRLDALRGAGRFLVMPATTQWWLDHYEGLAGHLATTARVAADVPEVCRVYELWPSRRQEL